MNIHFSIRALDNCQNLLESYGEICVHCNNCGRFDEAIKENEEAEKSKDDDL